MCFDNVLFKCVIFEHKENKRGFRELLMMLFSIVTMKNIDKSRKKATLVVSDEHQHQHHEWTRTRVIVTND